MAHATFQTLQHQGDHVEPTYGHGAQQLSVVCAMGMLRAFVVDQTPQRCGAVCRAVWTKLGSTRLVWERMRALWDDEALQSMRQRLATLLDGLKKRPPLWAVDAS
jgi:hypothetical protein